MGEYTQNVPLSVTYATAPALDATYRGSPVNIVGTSGIGHLVTTATGDGLVTVYDLCRRLKRTHCFYVTQYDSPVLECCLQEFGHNYSWSNLEDGRSVAITSLTVVGDNKLNSQVTLQNKRKGNTGNVNNLQQSSIPAQENIPTAEETSASSDAPKTSKTIRPVVICGLTIKGRLIANNEVSKSDSQMIIEDLNPKNFTNSSTCLCLVVYDFQYTKDIDRDPEVTKKVTSPKTVSNIIASMINDIEYNLIDAPNSSDAMSFINDMNYQAIKILKQTESNNYQNLIPGESDDIFIPPPSAVQSISGTRVLVVDDAEEPDASNNSPKYQFMNGLNSPTEASSANNIIEKSISDHITELKCSKSKKLNYSHAVQCIVLPAEYKNEKDLEIFDIVPTRNSTHILVVLRSLSGESANVLLVYSLCLGGSVVKLNEKPIMVRELPPGQCPVEVSVIPGAEKTIVDDGDVKPALDGSAVIVCADGIVRIFDLATLKPICVAKLDNEKFVSAVYCNSKYYGGEFLFLLINSFI